MELDILTIWNRLQEEQKYHQQLAVAYQAVLNDLQRMLNPAEIKTKKNNSRKGIPMTEEHKKKLREAHARRRENKKKAEEKQRINMEQIKLLQPTQ